MAQVVIFIVISVVTFGISYFLRCVSKDMFENGIDAIGVIRERLLQDSGNISYIVEFTNEQGQLMRGDTETYASTQGKYKAGEKVHIRYVIGRRGKPFAKVVDDDLTDCSDASFRGSKVALGISIASAILAVVFLIKNIIL